MEYRKSTGRTLASALLILAGCFGLPAQADDPASSTSTSTSATEAAQDAFMPVDEAMEKARKLPDPPADPIAVPTLPPDADKAALLEAYYAITGEPMMARVLGDLDKAPERLLTRAADCPPAQAWVREVFGVQMPPIFERLVSDLNKQLVGSLDEALTETDLRAFLRFAATPDGQRHLNGIIQATGNRNELQHYPAYEQDAELRGYSRHLDIAADGLSETLSAFQRNVRSDSELLALMTAARGQYGKLMEECRGEQADGT